MSSGQMRNNLKLAPRRASLRWSRSLRDEKIRRGCVLPSIRGSQFVSVSVDWALQAYEVIQQSFRHEREQGRVFRKDFVSQFNVDWLDLLCQFIETILFDGFDELSIIFPVREFVFGYSGTLGLLVVTVDIGI